MLEILKNIQSVQAKQGRDIGDIKVSLLSLSHNVHGMRDDLLRNEKALASLEVDVDRINARLNLADPSN